VLAAPQRVRIDAQQRQHSRSAGRHPFAERIVVLNHRRRRGVERPQHGQRQSGVAARRVNGDVRRLPIHGDPRGILTPGRQPVPPLRRLLRGELVDGLSVPRRFRRIHPRTKVLGLQLRERQQQVAQVTLGIDGNCRNAVDGRFFQERKTEPCLAAARHADTHRVRGQIFGFVQQPVIERLALAKVVLLAQVENAQFLEILRHDEPTEGVYQEPFLASFYRTRWPEPCKHAKRFE